MKAKIAEVHGIADLAGIAILAGVRQAGIVIMTQGIIMVEVAALVLAQ